MAFEFGMFHEFQRTVGVSDEEAFAASFEEIDAAERWRLDAMWLAEIHVNPFQVVRKNPSGADELVLEDTLLVPPGVGPDNNLISQKVMSGRAIPIISANSCCTATSWTMRISAC